MVWPARGGRSSALVVGVRGDDVQVALTRTDRNGDVDDIGVTGTAGDQADGASRRVIQWHHLGALVAEQCYGVRSR
jgi:hypothetical protein